MIFGQLNAAMFGEERLKHLFVLFLGSAREMGQAARGYAEIHWDGVSMKFSNPAGDAENHFELVFVSNKHIDQRQNVAFATVKDAPAAEANYIDIRKEVRLSFRGRGCHDLFIHERLARERALDVGSCLVFFQ